MIKVNHKKSFMLNCLDHILKIKKNFMQWEENIKWEELEDLTMDQTQSHFKIN